MPCTNKFLCIQCECYIYLPSLFKLNDIFLSSITGETATKEIHLQNAPEQSPETLAPRQVAPSDSILEEAEDDEEHKTQNASSSSCQSDGFKIPATPVSISFMYHVSSCMSQSAHKPMLKNGDKKFWEKSANVKI